MDDHPGAAHNPRTNCVVIGGQGFIGRFLVLRLLKLGNWIVRIADSTPSLDVEQQSLLFDAVSNGRTSYFQVDVRDKSQLFRGPYLHQVMELYLLQAVDQGVRWP